MVTRTAGVSREETSDEAVLRAHQIAAHALQQGPASSIIQGDNRVAAVVVIHRQPLFRDCLVRCLEHIHQSCVVLAFSSLAEWFAAAAKHPSPAAIVACVSGRNSIDPELRRELAQLSARKIDLPALIISDAQDLETVAMQVRRAVKDFLSRRTRFRTAISLTRGEDNLVVSGQSEKPGGAASVPAVAAFNARQLAILEALSKGKGTKEIAGELQVRQCTVRVQVRTIMKRLNARTRSEIAALAGRLLGGEFPSSQEGLSTDHLSAKDSGSHVMNMSKNRLHAVVIDPQRLRQAGLVRLLEEWADARGLAVATISTPQEFDVGPNCAIVVLNVGGGSVLEQDSLVWIRRVRASVPDVPLVILSDREDRREILAAFEQGAKGFIGTNLDPSLALDALTFLLQGGSFFPLSVLLEQSRMPAAKAADGDHNGNAAEQVPAAPAPLPVPDQRVRAAHSPESHTGLPLTPRQAEVLERLREGKPNKLIARELNMTEATVKVHVRQIMRKFGASNRTQAVLCATRMSSSARGN